MKHYPVNRGLYDGRIVRGFIADVVVEDAVIVELKCVRRIMVFD